MSSVIVLDNEYVKITHEKENRILFYVWKKHTVKQPYREVMLRGVEYANGTDIKYFLSDMSRQGIVGPDDRKWFESEVMPKAIEKGLKKVAVVFDGNAFKKHYLNMLLGVLKNHQIPMKVFSDMEKARAWLVEE